jgi:hypothetical protein
MLKRTFLIWTAACAFGADVMTFHNDNARTGQNLNETILTTANVNAGAFGKLFVISVDGRVDTQPLYVFGLTFSNRGTHNALYVATEHGTVYAFDADNGGLLWSVSTLAAGEAPSDDRGCSQVSPEIGVTSTPVISRNNGPNGTLYLVAMSKTGAGVYHQRLHALDLTTGAEQFGGPVEVQATFPGTGDNSSGGQVIFDPKQYKERAALLLYNGSIYTSWASHCDIRPYTGWLISYSANTLAKINTFNFTPNGAMGAVWMAGGGPAVDDAGNIYFLAANGTFDSTVNAQGFPAQGNYGNAFMKLSTANNIMAVADFFAMSNVASENNSDQDLGSGGELLLPDMLDANNATRHLAVGAGTDRHIYLVDRDNMGKFNSMTNAIYQDLVSGLSGGEFAVPAYFNGRLFYGGSGDLIRGFQFANARLPASATWTTPNTFPYPGATPSISANGTANGIVWAVANTNPAVLYAFDAGDLHLLYNSTQAQNGRDNFGAGNKYITPTVVNGKVYVGTTNGVGVFGILPTQQPPVITSPTAATGTVGTAFNYQITATNNPSSFSATGLPANLSVNTSTGLISGTPATEGNFSVTLGAANSSGTGNATLSLTINPSTPVPMITSSGTLSGVRREPVNYQISATNNPTSYSAAGLPRGLTLNASTGLISGSVSNAGTTTATIMAINVAGTGSKQLVIAITKR